MQGQIREIAFALSPIIRDPVLTGISSTRPPGENPSSLWPHYFSIASSAGFTVSYNSDTYENCYICMYACIGIVYINLFICMLIEPCSERRSENGPASSCLKCYITYDNSFSIIPTGSNNKQYSCF